MIQQDGLEEVFVGSVAELEQLSGRTGITDIHRHFIDDITIPSKRGKEFGVLKRVDEVFDCWFESGSMPYAYLHYPFENKELFDGNFPADFVAEGLDQTRGWCDPTPGELFCGGFFPCLVPALLPAARAICACGGDGVRFVSPSFHGPCHARPSPMHSGFTPSWFSPRLSSTNPRSKTSSATAWRAALAKPLCASLHWAERGLWTCRWLTALP